MLVKKAGANTGPFRNLQHPDAWNYVRAACVTCGNSRSVVLRGIDGDAGTVKAETCDDCLTYAKMLYQAKDVNVDPIADDLATLGLDVLVAEAGWSRHAPNPMLLIGQRPAIVGARVSTFPSRHGPARCPGHLSRHSVCSGGPEEPGHDGRVSRFKDSGH